MSPKSFLKCPQETFRMIAHFEESDSQVKWGFQTLLEENIIFENVFLEL